LGEKQEHKMNFRVPLSQQKLYCTPLPTDKYENEHTGETRLVCKIEGLKIKCIAMSRDRVLSSPTSWPFPFCLHSLAAASVSAARERVF
jgi:hypothetical protein